MNNLSHEELIAMGYKEFDDNSTINGTILFKRMNKDATFMFGFNNKQELICDMCLSDTQIKELMQNIG